MDNFDQWCADRGYSIADDDGVVKANVTFGLTPDGYFTVKISGESGHFVDQFVKQEDAGEWARGILVTYFNMHSVDAARIVAGAHKSYLDKINQSSISLHVHADGTVHDHTRQVGHGAAVLEPLCPSCHQHHNENADCDSDKICLHDSSDKICLHDSCEYEPLVAGRDYDESVCPSCGKDKHTAEELAVCMDSLLPPPPCAVCNEFGHDPEDNECVCPPDCDGCAEVKS